MKRKIFWIALVLCSLLCLSATAEISTNLKLEKELTTGKRVAKQTWVDNAGNPVMADDLGYCTLVNTYTTGTKLSKTEYFDAEGNPCNNTWGFHVRKLAYDVNNIRLEQFFDVDGNLVNGDKGYAVMEAEWYQGKRHQETRYFTADGEPLRSDTLWVGVDILEAEPDEK